MDPVADVTGRAAQRAHQPGLTAAAAVVVLAVLALWAIRLTGPPDLMHRDQERPATYVLDAVVNHHWLVQRDPYGAVASKPPLVPWISALVATVRGRLDRVALTLFVRSGRDATPDQVRAHPSSELFPGVSSGWYPPVDSRPMPFERSRSMNAVS